MRLAFGLLYHRQEGLTMMRRRQAGSFCTLWVILASGAAAQDRDPATTIRVETRLVVLHATVLDREGRPVEHLPESAFTVYENGVRQKPSAFRREDVPVSLGLVIDSSGSMRDKREEVAAAALALVEASNPADEVFVVNFSDAPSLDVDFTSDRARLRRGLERIDARGGTAMRDALRTSLEHVRHRTAKDKKVLLVVTDGDDNSSVETLEHLVRVAQQSEVLIYAIGLLEGEPPALQQRARRDLEALARATGGQAYFLRDVAEIRQLTPQIAHELRNQYILAYTPTDDTPDGQFRQIRVVIDRPEFTIRTRAGYYAPNGKS